MKMNLDIRKVKIVVTVPWDNLGVVREAVFEAGAGVIGKYSRCSTVVKSVGTFKPEEGAAPKIGEVGKFEEVKEARLEFVCDMEKLTEVLTSLHQTHPYEEPAIDVIPLLDL